MRRAAALGVEAAGTLRALAVAGRQRSPLMPNVPTIAEVGLPGYGFDARFMVMAPAATPSAVIGKQARQRLVAELPQWAMLVKQRGISIE